MSFKAVSAALATNFKELDGLHLQVIYDPVQARVVKGGAKLERLKPLSQEPSDDNEAVEQVVKSIDDVQRLAGTIEKEMNAVNVLVKNRDRGLPEDIFAVRPPHAASILPGVETLQTILAFRSTGNFSDERDTDDSINGRRKADVVKRCCIGNGFGIPSGAGCRGIGAPKFTAPPHRGMLSRGCATADGELVCTALRLRRTARLAVQNVRLQHFL
eukprot:TRINITY_DN57363_c0_g1_i1.p1 TRINITY_DN57363_c0_g1~~TRINITY_DN57363_c0_g1_i1.p1  ORF type:complete len:215 (-),score=37.52 TRINITY_DN57363_c0_g1_i1:49-693(-)